MPSVSWQRFSTAAMATRIASIIYLISLVLFLPHSSAASIAISAEKSLSGDATITSASGNFELGFFQPGTSQYYYLGIWYKQVSEPTVVWVANRDDPLPDKSSSELKIVAGNLALVRSNSSKDTPIWSTNLINPPNPNSNSTEAVLLDSGNLVLRETPDSSETIWESFDHPTHTWLPGSKLGLNKRTNKTQLLSSWKSENDPSSGIFSLEHDPNGSPQYFIVWNRSKIYWTSGEWNGRFFSRVPEMRSNYMYNNIQFNFSYVTNENESYFTYGIHNSSIKSRFIIDFSGQIKQLSWLDGPQKWYLFWSQPQHQCSVYSLCGPFGVCNEKVEDYCECLPEFIPASPHDWNSSDWTKGCKRDADLQCYNERNSTKERGRDGFSNRPNMRLPENPQAISVESLEECESTCLSNCSCTAYSYEENVISSSSRCSMWIGNLLNLQQFSQDDGDGKTLYIRLAPSEFIEEDDNHKVKVIGIATGSVAAILALSSLVLVIILVNRSRRSNKSAKTVEGSLLLFGYRDLQTATNNFSEKLGGGGFGSVYKGTLLDSTAVAVKKLEGVTQGEKQFRAEVSTIGTIQHVNLVRLRGFCSEGAKRLLVYEYMPNGSLAANLFHGTQALDWKTRYGIALGTARGLGYLHEKCRDCIIHCDIKPENILLDGENLPKVADFGLAKLLGREFSRVLTTIRGTRGYLAPEWISGTAITAKADVYSFGMMLFELVSGRRNSEPSDDGEIIDFFPSSAANRVWLGKDLLGLLDPRLEGGTVDMVELERVLRVACWCVQDEEIHRPSMGLVIRVLEGFSEAERMPVPRLLQLFVTDPEKVFFFSQPARSQRNS